MASQPCDLCDESVTIGGGIAAIWSFAPEPTGGMTLEFPDGTEAFLCFSCIEDLPEDPTPADITAAIAEERSTRSEE